MKNYKKLFRRENSKFCPHFSWKVFGSNFESAWKWWWRKVFRPLAKTGPSQSFGSLTEKKVLASDQVTQMPPANVRPVVDDVDDDDRNELGCDLVNEGCPSKDALSYA